MSTYFVTGIDTNVGKTVASAILVEALKADYWKPIQAGDLEHCDTKKVESLVTNSESKFHTNSYALKTPMSPHAAAEIDGITISIDNIKPPKTSKNLIIEGAGGLLVPMNDENVIADIIEPSYKVIVVSRHYLGSINHTLLTLDFLKKKKLETYLIFSGNEHPTTEQIISKRSGVPVIGRIEEEPYFDQNVISEYASLFREKL